MQMHHQALPFVSMVIRFRPLVHISMAEKHVHRKSHTSLGLNKKKQRSGHLVSFCTEYKLQPQLSRGEPGRPHWNSNVIQHTVPCTGSPANTGGGITDFSPILDFADSYFSRLLCAKYYSRRRRNKKEVFNEEKLKQRETNAYISTMFQSRQAMLRKRFSVAVWL